MPSIITHTLFALELIEEVKHPEIKRILLENSKCVELGSNGPDFLFYSNAMPWQQHLDQSLSKVGSIFHSKHINLFYDLALSQIDKQTKQDKKEAMMAYLFGHLMHWCLDKTSHPYVFYKTGRYDKHGADYHHRMESQIDAIMLKIKKNQTTKQFKPQDIVTFTKKEITAISRIYIPIMKQILNKEVHVIDIKKTLEQWHDTIALFHDPNQVKYNLFYPIEKLLKMPWKFSGYFTTHFDTNYDEMNFMKKTWCHPCDDQMISNESFLELYEKAFAFALEVIEITYDCILNQNHEPLLKILDNQSYDTGLNCLMEMKYYDVIYE